MLFTLLLGSGMNIDLPAAEAIQIAETTTAVSPLPFIYDVRTAWMAREEEQPISEYDEILQRIGVHEKVDWRLLSAIAYHESRFKNHVVSTSGARGIMQVRPVVARHFNIPVSRITDVETNVMLAAKLLNTIEKGLSLTQDVPAYDRMSLMLACYNAGERPVATARTRAKASGRNADSWGDVSRFVGRGETRAFVRNVMAQYDHYCSIRNI